MLETDGSGATLARYILAGAELISQTRGLTTSYYLEDGQGNTRALTGSAGTITDSYAYNAFGEIYSQTGSTTNSYLYAGQQFDALTGLYNLRARYYSPGLGRFLTQDVYPYNFSNPIELNRYGYAANSPINYSDPTGYVTFVEYATNVGKGALAGAALGGLSDAAIQLLTKPINEFSWMEVLQSTVAGAVSGAVGALFGTIGAALGKGFVGTVFKGMLGGVLEGLVARGTLNLQVGKTFFDDYSWQDFITDAVVGGLFSGYFYVKTNRSSRGLPAEKFFTPDELTQYNDLKQRYPDWMPPDDARFQMRSKAETEQVRSQVKTPGHHRHPLKFGGDPDPSEGLKHTGDTRYSKNPIHTAVTNFWNTVMRARKK